jgi:hypothetical protein
MERIKMKKLKKYHRDDDVFIIKSLTLTKKAAD